MSTAVTSQLFSWQRGDENEICPEILRFFPVSHVRWEKHMQMADVNKIAGTSDAGC